ncbi:MAG: rhodanese-like domain-containing protein [Bacteroidetes bacterium]|nr:rhodanese-like domain-containing protein [Bacteroidota bacterium]
MKHQEKDLFALTHTTKQGYLRLFISLLITTSFLACVPESRTNESPASVSENIQAVENITIEQAVKLMEDESVVILDVRTQQEVDQGFIEGAKHIDFYAENFKEQIAALDTSATYLVYCRSGNRSGQASTIMTEDLNFKHVKNLLGGYQAWSKQ